MKETEQDLFSSFVNTLRIWLKVEVLLQNTNKCTASAIW